MIFFFAVADVTNIQPFQLHVSTVQACIGEELRTPSVQAHQVDCNPFYTSCLIHLCLRFVLPFFTTQTDLMHSWTRWLALRHACLHAACQGPGFSPLVCSVHDPGGLLFFLSPPPPPTHTRLGVGGTFLSSSALFFCASTAFPFSCLRLAAFSSRRSLLLNLGNRLPLLICSRQLPVPKRTCRDQV